MDSDLTEQRKLEYETAYGGDRGINADQLSDLLDEARADFDDAGERGPLKPLVAAHRPWLAKAVEALKLDELYDQFE